MAGFFWPLSGREQPNPIAFGEYKHRFCLYLIIKKRPGLGLSAPQARIESGAYTSWLPARHRSRSGEAGGEATPTAFSHQRTVPRMFYIINSGSGILPRLMSISIRATTQPLRVRCIFEIVSNILDTF